jgi:hypothetical protein
MKEHYLKYVMLTYAASGAFDSFVGADWRPIDELEGIKANIIVGALSQFDLNPPPGIYDQLSVDLVQALQNGSALVVDGDEYAGLYFRLIPENKANVVKNLLSKNPISGKVATLGGKILERALTRISEEDDYPRLGHRIAKDDSGGESSMAPLDIPASDRIVSLNHNQVSEADSQIGELLERLEIDNGDPNNSGLRERVIGQIKAGRELVRSGEYRAYLLYEVLVKALQELTKKYGNETIVALANALLGAVVSKLLESH